MRESEEMYNEWYSEGQVWLDRQNGEVSQEMENLHKVTGNGSIRYSDIAKIW